MSGHRDAAFGDGWPIWQIVTIAGFLALANGRDIMRGAEWLADEGLPRVGRWAITKAVDAIKIRAIVLDAAAGESE